MDQCEDTQEGAPPSKNTLFREDERQSKAQRNQPGPGSESSRVSFRSDKSKNKNPDFKAISSGVEQGQQVTRRVQSAASSCGSMKSDWSKGEPPDFKTEPGPSDSQKKRSRPESAERPRTGESGPDGFFWNRLQGLC
ncbi:hypothetical protein OJAV_G00016290 [Oryzias javanicus]|uniref:Uncharacterized protein n=1 Tax=Oryzias javanicus TaxID=123683 RepID=A0A437DKR6_ORYJA|nr:hypothetical protein OJAV_G00016290 [Oryzias javanicus]